MLHGWTEHRDSRDQEDRPRQNILTTSVGADTNHSPTGSPTVQQTAARPKPWPWPLCDPPDKTTVHENTGNFLQEMQIHRKPVKKSKGSRTPEVISHHRMAICSWLAVTAVDAYASLSISICLRSEQNVLLRSIDGFPAPVPASHC
jgi:hypothetical protein